MKGAYNTKQKGAVRLCLMKASAAMTAENLRQRLVEEGMSIGLATIYRQLEKLVEEGVVVRRALYDGNSAGYQYIGEPEAHHAHAHLVCLVCGQMEHVDCAFANQFTVHMLNDHNFHVDRMKTLFYGYCEACLKHAPQAGAAEGASAAPCCACSHDDHNEDRRTR
ncbi:transcriptional repressor [Christensenellaceae bacterium OttesenSCG-928-M15]|nr:transcriptional repressor [Christensenellaceae bacterium OttesenSCG-928-M15]